MVIDIILIRSIHVLILLLFDFPSDSNTFPIIWRAVIVVVVITVLVFIGNFQGIIVLTCLIRSKDCPPTNVPLGSTPSSLIQHMSLLARYNLVDYPFMCYVK